MGRPRLLDKDIEQEFRNIGHSYATTRTVQNVSKLGRSLNVLSGIWVQPDIAKRWGWLLRPNPSGAPHVRRAISYQLGHTKCDVALRVFADRLCELKPTAQTAIKFLRCWQEWFDGMVTARAYYGEIVNDTVRQELAELACQRSPQTSEGEQ
jgi:hypothetical protein